jgi:hypothetical protein
MLNWLLGNQPIPYARTGTTPAIPIRRDPKVTPEPVRAGKDYFLIQVAAAQAAYRGAVWDQVEKLVIVSQVNLNHKNLDNRGMCAIQRTRKVEKNQSQPLGLCPNLISLIPAVMPSVTLCIAFLLDKKNRLALLGGLINSDSFLSTLSLAPGASAVAKTVAGLADKLLQSFLPAEETKPILEFNGDFNIATGSLQDCYYAIMGSKDDAEPLPEPGASLEVHNNELFVDGRPATQWSYVLLDVRRTCVRPRELSDGAAWDTKLKEAEDRAHLLLDNPLASEQKKREAWGRCLELIGEAQTLLRADDNFLREDAINLIKTTLYSCRKLIAADAQRTANGAFLGTDSYTDLTQDLATLRLPASVNLEDDVDGYVEHLARARQLLNGLS